MKRILIVVSAAVIALAGTSFAQSPQNTDEPRRGRDVLDCGPGRGPAGPGAALAPGRAQRAPALAMQGRGRGGRPGGIGRPGGPGRGGPGGRGPGGGGHALCGLDLTDEQKTQIAAIQQKSREDIQAVLTPEQREKLLARRGGR